MYKLVEIRCMYCNSKLLDAAEGSIISVKCRKSSCGQLTYGRVVANGVVLLEPKEQRKVPVLVVNPPSVTG